MSTQSRRSRSLVLAALTTLTAVAGVAAASPAGATCLDFTAPPAGTTYVLGPVFATPGYAFSMAQFQWSTGAWTADHSEISPSNLAGGTPPKELLVDNITPTLNFTAGVNQVTFRFAEFGGNVNLRVNGGFVNLNDLPPLFGAVVGGANIAGWAVPVFGGYMGVMTINGNIGRFGVGGQELFIDDVCF